MDLRASSLPLLVISTKDVSPLNKTADLGTSGEEKETQEKIYHYLPINTTDYNDRRHSTGRCFNEITTGF